MLVDLVFLRDGWWMDTDQAAAMLRVSPASLKRNHSQSFPGIESIVWHHVRLFRASDVSEVSAQRITRNRHI